MQKEEQENIEAWMRTATDFHGHLGPFLVIGVRMAIVGLRELHTSRGNLKLCALAKLERTVPFSCTIDGIQAVSQCTIGNGRLRINSAKNRIAVCFQLEKKQAAVRLRPVAFEELKKSLPETANSLKTIQLARKIASLPESELFTVKTK